MGSWCLIAVVGLLGCPLPGTGRALGQFPFVVKQHLQITVVPLGRGRCPGAFQAAADLITADTAAVGVLPAETLLLDRRRFRFRTDQGRITGAVALAESVSTGGQRHRLLVVHGHAGEGLPYIPARGDGIGLAVGAFRIHVDQPHLHRGKWVFQLVVVAGVTLVIQPTLLVTPVDVLLRLPDILAPGGETEGLEAHGLKRHVTGQDQQIGPGDAATILLLNRPEQAPRLVQVDVVGPAVDGCEALVAGTGTTASVSRTVGPGTVPGHADEHGAIVAVVGRPPLLGVGHQVPEILFQCLVVELTERLGVIKILLHGIRLRGVLAQNVQIQLVGPPVPVGCTTARSVVERAFTDFRHYLSPFALRCDSDS